MKANVILQYIQAAIIAVAVCLTVHAKAAKVVKAEEPREKLAHAYRLLAHADHDYDGHRVKAMNEVEAAAKELGIALGGDLPEHERQWKSDEHLRHARTLLREAHAKLEHKDRRRVAKHIKLAIEEIDTALKIK